MKIDVKLVQPDPESVEHKGLAIDNAGFDPWGEPGPGFLDALIDEEATRRPPPGQQGRFSAEPEHPDDDEGDEGDEGDTGEPPHLPGGDVSDEVLQAIDSLMEAVEESRIDRAAGMALRHEIHRDAKAEMHSAAKIISKAATDAVAAIDQAADRQAKARAASDIETKRLAANVTALLSEVRQTNAATLALASGIDRRADAGAKQAAERRREAFDRLLGILAGVAVGFCLAWIFIGSQPPQKSESPGFTSAAPVPDKIFRR